MAWTLAVGIAVGGSASGSGTRSWQWYSQLAVVLLTVAVLAVAVLAVAVLAVAVLYWLSWYWLFLSLNRGRTRVASTPIPLT